MYDIENKDIDLEFINSKQKYIAKLSDLIDTAINFLEHFGNPQFCSQDFIDIVGVGSGKLKLSRLADKLGFDGNYLELFKTIISEISKCNCYEKTNITINQIELPYLFVLNLR